MMLAPPQQQQKQPAWALTTLPRELQKRIYDRVDLGGLAASARVSRAWLRSVRENSILSSLHQLRLWPTASLRKLAVHLTWQSVVQAPPSLPTLTGISAPLLVLDGLAAWVTHDNEYEAGLQLLEHVRQLVSVGGDGNTEWSTPATVSQREWMTGVSVLPAAANNPRTLCFSLPPTLNARRQTHVRLAFSLSQLPDYRFFLKLEFERAQQQRCSVFVMCRKRDGSDEVMDVLFNSDATGLHVAHGASIGFDPRTNMYIVRPERSQDQTTPITKEFLNGTWLLVSFVYAPAAEQLQRQIDTLNVV